MISQTIRRGFSRSQRARRQSRPRRRAGREVLHEDVGLFQHAPQQRGVVGGFDVEGQRFLAAIEPDEIGALAMRDLVVFSRQVAALAFDLYDPRPRVGEP